MTGRHRGRRRPLPWRGKRVTGALLAVLAMVPSAPIGVPSAAVELTSAAVSSAPAFTATKTVSRINYNDGADDVADTRSVTVSVSQTTDLRDRQGISVTWSGAHPTGGLATDDTSPYGAYEEYPVVVIECRGTDSSSVTASKQVSPRTCYTQTPNERFGYSSNTVFPVFRMDRYATPADRDYNVGEPANVSPACPGFAATYWVPFVGADGSVYRGGYDGCDGMAPEQSVTEASLQPGSTTYGVAGADGSGSTDFIVQSDLSNSSLGCSQTVACTLEVIPIEGISCDPAGDVPGPGGMPAGEAPPPTLVSRIEASCEDTGSYAPGEYNNSGQADYSSTTGQYWWSASNWRNRIAVPLSFAQSAEVCNTVSSSSTAYLYGSEALNQAAQQWSPYFCLNPTLFNLRTVQTSEPEAKNLLSIGNIEAAVQAAPGTAPYTTPTVQAPTAISGFAIAFDVDGSDKKPYPQLRLDARLLAKLMTESYEACALDCLHDPALASNPIDITRDPEFQALNPGVPPTEDLTAAAALSLISADSDIIDALTSYINDDPEARAWLNGKPDPWGMVVNPAYEGIDLPVTRWPLLDTHVADFGGGSNPCVANTPWLPLVASPVEDPALIAENAQYDINNAQVVCANAGQPTQKLVSVGRQQQGSRFLLGLVSLADAQRYSLPVAALETQRTTNSNVVFTDASGRSFVAPTPASLKAAADMMQPDDAEGTWDVDYDAMRTQAAGLNAYPGTVLLSTDVPTKGLPKTDATDYAKFLDFVAGTGQTTGSGNGQLPVGYLPLTKANGLASMVAYTQAAAEDVAAQQCVVPYPSGKSAPAPSCNLPKSASGSSTARGHGTSSSSSGGGSATGSSRTASGAAATTTAPGVQAAKPTAGAARAPSSIAAAPAGRVSGFSSGAGGLVLPGLLVLALVAVGVSVFTTRTGARR